MNVTISDVAAAAGVSPMTVSRVTNHSARVSPHTRERVLRVMDELGYIPNRLARGLVGSRLGVVALVVSDLSNPYFTRLASAVEAAAREQDLIVIVGNSRESPEVESEYVQRLLALRVDGLVLTPAGDESLGTLRTLAARGTPHVLVDRQVAGAHADVVRVDSRAAAGQLVRHLVDSGHTRIGAVVGWSTMSSHEERLAGWRDVAGPLTRGAGDDLVERSAPTRPEATRAALRLLEREDRPTAVLAGNNVQAFGVLDAAEQLGLQVPDDLAIVAFDDVEVGPQAPYFSSGDGPVEDLGTAAVRLLLERLDDPGLPPRDLVYASAITLRRSCHHDHG